MAAKVQAQHYTKAEYIEMASLMFVLVDVENSEILAEAPVETDLLPYVKEQLLDAPESMLCIYQRHSIIGE